MPHYIDSKKANRKAWIFAITVIVVIYVILILTGAS